MKKFLLASNLEFSLGQVGVRLRWMIDNVPGLRQKIRSVDSGVDSGLDIGVDIGVDSDSVLF